MIEELKQLITKYQEMIPMIIEDNMLSEQTKSSAICLLRMTVISDLEKLIGKD